MQRHQTVATVFAVLNSSAEPPLGDYLSASERSPIDENWRDRQESLCIFSNPRRFGRRQAFTACDEGEGRLAYLQGLMWLSDARASSTESRTAIPQTRTAAVNSICNEDDCTQRRIQLVSMVIDALPDDTLKIVMAEVDGLDVLVVLAGTQTTSVLAQQPANGGWRDCRLSTWTPKVSENILADYLLNSSDCAANPKLETCSGCGNARDFDLIAAAVRRQHPRNPPVGSTEACVERPGQAQAEHPGRRPGIGRLKWFRPCPIHKHMSRAP